MRRIANAVGILCSLVLLAPGPATAQDNPSRPVRLVVSFPPGGGVDAVARLFADKMSALLGQTWWWKTAAAPAASLPASKSPAPSPTAPAC
jgi:tripartite-type tricarboxylate transporter receptor subunit TctC